MAHQAISEHEMSNILPQRTYTRLGLGDNTATFPTEFIAGEFDFSSKDGAYPKLKNGTVKVTSAYPTVNTRCWDPSDRVTTTTELAYWKHDLKSLEEDDLFVDGSSHVWFAPVWIPSPEPGSHHSIAVFLDETVPKDFVRGHSDTLEDAEVLLRRMLNHDEDEDEDEEYLNVYTCTISADWNVGEINLIDENGFARIMVAQSSLTSKPDARPITLDFTGASAEIMRTAEFSRLINQEEETLAVMTAIAISKVPTRAMTALYDHNNQSNALGASDQIRLQLTTTVHGFGYGTRSTSVYLSMTVIAIYCVIVVGYLLYTLFTGSVSTAWSTGIELVTLALQSRKPDHLRHTGVRIDSIKTYGEGVGVRINADDELELVFAHDRDSGTDGLRKLARNTEY